SLYSREGDVSNLKDIQEIISKVVSRVPDAQVASDLDAAVTYARGTGKADTTKLGVTGFCWGGRQVWLYAAHNPNVKAAVAWYGAVKRPGTDLQPKNPLDLVGQLKAPVLGLYGGAAPGIPGDGREEMKTALKAAHNPSEIVIYPATPHGFNADYRPSYRPDQAKDGWNKMQAWFKQHGVG